MIPGPGTTDSEGVYHLGEADNPDGTFSGLMQLVTQAISTALGLLRARIEKIENRTAYTRASAVISSGTAFQTIDFANTPLAGAGFTESAGVFTCVDSGVYRIELAVTYAPHATGLRGAGLLGPSSVQRALIVNAISGAIPQTVPVVWPAVSLTAGDTITAQALQSSGADRGTAAEILFERIS